MPGIEGVKGEALGARKTTRNVQPALKAQGIRHKELNECPVSSIPAEDGISASLQPASSPPYYRRLNIEYPTSCTR